MCATLDEDPALGGTPLAAQAEGYLLSTLLVLASHNPTRALQAGSRRPLMPRSVRRAQEFLHSAIAEPLTLADICQHLGVSARALQLALKQNTGQSPMAYLRDIRLDRVRQALLQAANQPKATVSEVVAQHGFLHLGHFAAQYRRRFGELPAQTLHATGPVVRASTACR